MNILLSKEIIIELKPAFKQNFPFPSPNLRRVSQAVARATIPCTTAFKHRMALMARFEVPMTVV